MSTTRTPWSGPAPLMTDPLSALGSSTAARTRGASSIAVAASLAEPSRIALTIAMCCLTVDRPTSGVTQRNRAGRVVSWIAEMKAASSRLPDACAIVTWKSRS